MNDHVSPLAHITLNQVDKEKVLALLAEQGVVIIPDYISSEELAEMNKEFDAVLQKTVHGDGVKGCISRGPEVGEAVLMTREEADEDVLPTTLEFFRQPFMEELKNSYWGAEATLNNEIYVCRDIVGTRHEANDLHFDVVPKFKFFIYLTDTTRENGAFSCLPGSHIKTQALRKKHGKKISYKNRPLSRIPEEEENAIPIEGKAGTLIIFTTEVWHKAGQVAEGERRTMRGHCRRSNDERGLKNFLKKIVSH